MGKADISMQHHTSNRGQRLRRSSMIIGAAALTVGSVGAGVTDAASRGLPSPDVRAVSAQGRSLVAAVPAPAPRSAPVISPVLMAAPMTVDLCATTGSTTLKTATGADKAINVWGYVPGDCSSGSGTATLGGAPTIRAEVGQQVTVVLHNGLGVDSSLEFQGQGLPTDFTGAAPGSTATYNFTPDEPGTSLYGAGHTATFQVQQAMGLVGALIVTPAAAQQAYDDPSTGFEQEATLLLQDVDPALNNAAVPTSFDMRKFAPTYHVLGGKVFPQTGSIAVAAPADRVLLRYVNAGSTYHSMTVLGAAYQFVVGEDGHARIDMANNIDTSSKVVDQTVGPGQTIDAIVTVPSLPNGTRLSIFDGNLENRNGGRKPASTQAPTAAYGGVLSFIEVTSSCTDPCADSLGPVSTIGTFDPVTGVLNGTINDAATGASTIASAEYSIDAPSGPFVALDAVDGSFDSSTESVTTSVPGPTLAGLASGTHTIYVRGTDSLGNVGAVVARTFALDRQGPSAVLLVVTPSGANGTGAVVLRGTGDDTGRGGSTVDLLEYFIDEQGAAGTGTQMVPTTPAVTTEASASIPAATVAGLSAGQHQLWVRAHDVAGNWGDLAPVVLTVDPTGPVTTVGASAVNAATQSMRVQAHLVDTWTNVIRAEGFIDTVGVTGKGTLLIPVDGKWDSKDEQATLDIPLSTLALLNAGTHTVFVHGKDAAGNWGAVTSATFTVDRTAPTVGALGNPTTNLNRISIPTTATDNVGGSGIGRVEYFLDGNDPGRGAGTVLTHGAGNAYTAVVDTRPLAIGQHTITVRARDTAGNWSTVRSRTFSVANRAFYFTTAGNSNPPGVTGTADDSDVLRRNLTGYARMLTATSIGIPGSANVDGLVYNGSKVYVSFNNNTPVAVTDGAHTLSVADEDVAIYDATKAVGSRWSLYFDGSAHGFTDDIDAFDVVGNLLYFSTDNSSTTLAPLALPGVTGGMDDADIYAYSFATGKYSRIWKATGNGLAAAVDIDGLSVIAVNQYLFSFKGTTQVPDNDPASSSDVLLWNNSAWTLWFDGAANGLGTAQRNVDALDVP